MAFKAGYDVVVLRKQKPDMFV